MEFLEKRKWGKWKHVTFVEDFNAGIPVYELLRRECELSGSIQWKRVYVKNCVHGLCGLLKTIIN